MSGDMVAGARTKLRRAKRHIDDLRQEIEAFAASNPYQIVIEPDPEPMAPEIQGQDRWRARVGEQVEAPSDEIPVILGEAIHGMRSSLDLLVYPLAPNEHTFLLAWKQNRPPRGSEWRDLVKGRLGKAPSAVRAEIERLQMYPGGKDEWLWLLHHLDIIEKHRLLLTVGSASTRMSLSFAALLMHLPPEFRGEFLRQHRLHLAENPVPIVEPRTVLYRGLREHFETTNGVRFEFDVVFAEPALLRGKSVHAIAASMWEQTEQLIEKVASLS